MNTGEMLKELRQNILHDRSQQIAGIGRSYLWDDETLVRYINEAHRRLARKASVIRDFKTPEVVQFRLVTGQEFYELHPSILSVMSARIAGEAADLTRVAHSQLNATRQPGSGAYWFDVNALATESPGKPRAFTTDEGMTLADDGTASIINLRMFPKPDASWNNKLVTMRVVRLPLTDMRVDNLDFVPEAPAMYHLGMLDWAAFLALSMNDIDAGDPNEAARRKQRFDAMVEEINIEIKQRMFQPASWGFGRSGFNYTRY